jgi:hypothetical protein
VVLVHTQFNWIYHKQFFFQHEVLRNVIQKFKRDKMWPDYQHTKCDQSLFSRSYSGAALDLFEWGGGGVERILPSHFKRRYFIFSPKLLAVSLHFPLIRQFTWCFADTYVHYIHRSRCWLWTVLFSPITFHGGCHLSTKVIRPSRHFLIPWTSGAFAPLSTFFCTTNEERNGLLPQRQGPSTCIDVVQW